MYLKITRIGAGRISKTAAIIAIGLLLTYLTDAIFIEMYDDTLLLMDNEMKGAIFGVLSTILLVTAFVLEFREKSFTVSILLISGGIAMGTLTIAKDTLSNSGIANIATNFANAVSVGYIIMSLGVLHLVIITRKQRLAFSR